MCKFKTNSTSGAKSLAMTSCTSGMTFVYIFAYFYNILTVQRDYTIAYKKQKIKNAKNRHTQQKRKEGKKSYFFITCITLHCNMALSIAAWTKYAGKRSKMQKKGELAVESNHVLRFLFDPLTRRVVAVVQSSYKDKSYRVHVSIHSM